MCLKHIIYLGDDSITYRHLYSNNYVTTKNKSKIIVCTNNIPKFTNEDFALKRRLLLIHCRNNFSGPTNIPMSTLMNTLCNESCYNEFINLILRAKHADVNACLDFTSNIMEDGRESFTEFMDRCINYTGNQEDFIIVCDILKLFDPSIELEKNATLYKQRKFELFSHFASKGHTLSVSRKRTHAGNIRVIRKLKYEP